MALQANEITALRVIIARDGGLQAVIAEIQALGLADLHTSALSTLSPAISVTVTNWPTLATFIASGNSATMYQVMAAITAAAAAQDSTKLGPLFVALYAAVKANLGI